MPSKPEPTKRLVCRLPKALYSEFDMATNRRGYSPSEVMQRMLRVYLRVVWKSRAHGMRFVLSEDAKDEAKELASFTVELRESEHDALKVLVTRSGATIGDVVRCLACGYLVAAKETPRRNTRTKRIERAAFLRAGSSIDGEKT